MRARECLVKSKVTDHHKTINLWPFMFYALCSIDMLYTMLHSSDYH